MSVILIIAIILGIIFVSVGITAAVVGIILYLKSR